MILQALHDYYRRKMADPDPAKRLPAFGLEEKEIPFIIELTREGKLAAIKDTRRAQGKKKIAEQFLVPVGIKKAYGVAANLLWDTVEYVLGADVERKGRAANPERVRQQHAAFRGRIDDLPELARSDPGIGAVRAFLDSNPLDAVRHDPAWDEIRSTNPVLSFRLADDIDLVCQRPAVIAGAGASSAVESVHQGVCLVTGETTTATRVHTAIKGVWGAQTSGANIVSFNLDAFDSFGKEQGANAPVGPRAEFAYTTALNQLLGRNSRQRIQVGDASTVFWAQHPDEIEDVFGGFFAESPDDPDARCEQVRALLEAVHSGRFDGGRGQICFYILGLAPNAARIAVRFWHAAPLSVIARRVVKWFDDLEIVRGRNDPQYPSLFRLLAAAAVQGKADNIPPNLGGDIMRSILEGTPFPATWLNAAVRRCRAEQRVTYLNACAIRACLSRQSHYLSSSTELECKSMLDPSNPSPAYRLGRLFAVLEKIQEEASPGLNATIRERYYGAASSVPVSVFTTLLRLKNHHLAKIESRGRVVNLERLIGQIMDGIGDFPAHLALPDQGRFAIGYYHQRQALYSKVAASSDTAEPTT